ncbi:MAG: CHAP domain-containing protein, partial [Cystobacter sp.]
NSQGLCATGVSRAIQNAFGVKVWGNGNQIDNNLPRNKFQQVNMSLAEALKTPGLVLTWEKTSSRLGSIYGHTAITTGDGRSSVSDFIERNTLGATGRSGLKIFRPIL